MVKYFLSFHNSILFNVNGKATKWHTHLLLLIISTTKQHWESLQVNVIKGVVVVNNTSRVEDTLKATRKKSFDDEPNKEWN